MENILCIDFGTSYIKASIFHDGKITKIINENEEDTFLSSLFIDDNKVIFGEESLKRSSSNYKNYFEAMKINLASSFKREIENEIITCKEIIALILKRIKYLGENLINDKIEKAYLSVPNLFTSLERKELLEAGKLASLKIEKIFNESILGPIYYLKDKQEDGKHFLSIDFGGGYLDISCNEIFNGGEETLGVNKSPRLGGIDLDQIIVNLVKEKLNRDYEDLVLNNDQILRIFNEARRAKVYLSTHKEATIYIPFINDQDGNSQHISYSITLEEFKFACKDVIATLKEEICYTLLTSGISINEIDYIFLNGGSFSLPFFEEEIVSLFPNEKIIHLNKESTLNGLLYLVSTKDYLTLDILTLPIKSYNERLMGVERLKAGSSLPLSTRMVVTRSFIELRQGNASYFGNNTLLYNIDKKELTKGRVTMINLYVDTNGILNIYYKDEKDDYVLYSKEQNDKYSETKSIIDKLKIEIE